MDKEGQKGPTDARVKLFWKLILDLVIAGLMVWSFYVENFCYMLNYSFSISEVHFRFMFHGLPAYSTVDYSTFRSQHCLVPKEDEIEICDWIGIFRIAGLCYLIVCAFVLLLAVINFINELALMMYCSCSAFKRWNFFHYIHPFFYLIAVLLYALISNIIFLRAPTGKDQTFNSQPLFGIWLMTINFVLALCSCVYYLCIEGSEILLEAAANPGLQGLVNRHILRLP